MGAGCCNKTGAGAGCTAVSSSRATVAVPFCSTAATVDTLLFLRLSSSDESALMGPFDARGISVRPATRGVAASTGALMAAADRLLLRFCSPAALSSIATGAAADGATAAACTGRTSTDSAFDRLDEDCSSGIALTHDSQGLAPSSPAAARCSASTSVPLSALASRPRLRMDALTLVLRAAAVVFLSSSPLESTSMAEGCAVPRTENCTAGTGSARGGETKLRRGDCACACCCGPRVAGVRCAAAGPGVWKRAPAVCA